MPNRLFYFLLSLVVLCIIIILGCFYFQVKEYKTNVQQNYYESSQPVPVAEYSPARSLMLELYKAEVNATGIEPKEIKSFNNLSEPVYLRYEYISPEVVSAQFSQNCQVDRIDSFDLNYKASLAEDSSDVIKVTYSGPGSVVIAYFKKVVNTSTTYGIDPNKPIYLFDLGSICSSK